jgi:hypothetical protein
LDCWLLGGGENGFFDRELLAGVADDRDREFIGRGWRRRDVVWRDGSHGAQMPK